MERMLWRFESSPVEAAAEQLDLLTAGLRRHLAYASLTTVLMQIGDRQQAYVALDGCTGCAIGRCQPGCRADLLRRLLQACGAGTLRLVPSGLAARPYRRALLAFPTRSATPLDGYLLREWPDGRLIVHWQPRRGLRSHAIAASAILAAGAQGPELAEAFTDMEWRPFRPLGSLALAWAKLPVPPALPLGRCWHRPPALLTPRVMDTPSELAVPAGADMAAVSASPVAELAIDGALAGWLRSVLAHPTASRVVEEEQADDCDASLWPPGPGALQPRALGALVEQLIAEPSFQHERKGQSGLTKGRIAALRHPLVSEPIARALMVWFDAAGVLAQPEDGQSVWRAPRPFATTNLEEIAERLRATALPSADAVRAAYGGES